MSSGGPAPVWEGGRGYRCVREEEGIDEAAATDDGVPRPQGVGVALAAQSAAAPQ
ncbi:hypothetical protein GCM10010448_32320 [Streptomyces glomeratus]|uniref:Uncharacterized protein n=1 Tax=Streptomyces glomeratus TaxID=284452 RepID=A0ABP6LPE2_9ACTN